MICFYYWHNSDIFSVIQKCINHNMSFKMSNTKIYSNGLMYQDSFLSAEQQHVNSVVYIVKHVIYCAFFYTSLLHVTAASGVGWEREMGKTLQQVVTNSGEVGQCCW